MVCTCPCVMQNYHNTALVAHQPQQTTTTTVTPVTTAATAPLYGRKLSYPIDIDEQLVQWVRTEQANGTNVTPELLRREALKLIQPFCYEFKASTGWLDKFLARHKISLHGNSAVKSSDSNEFGSRHQLPTMADVSPISNHALVDNFSQVSASSPQCDNDNDMDEEDDDDEFERNEEKTTNPERVKAFNMFVRLFVDENLDRLIPISKQPKEKVNAIIMACQRQFPEYSERARKRIRTYLKSCRRSTRLREPNTKLSMTHIPAAQLAVVNDILAQACQNEADEAMKRQRQEASTTPSTPTGSVPERATPTGPVPTQGPTQSVHHHIKTEPEHTVKPVQKVLKEQGKTIYQQSQKSSYQQVTKQEIPTLPSFVNSAAKGPLMKLSESEVKSMKALIDGYRQSASYLHRSADELEKLLKHCEAYSDEEKNDSLPDMSNDSTATNSQKALHNHVSSNQIPQKQPDPPVTKIKTEQMAHGYPNPAVATSRANVYVTSISPQTDGMLTTRANEMSTTTTQLYQAKDGLLLPVQNVVQSPRVSEAVHLVPKVYFSPISPPEHNNKHLAIASNKSVNSPVRLDSPVTLYPVQLQKPSEAPEGFTTIYTQKNTDGTITQYQPIAPHKPQQGQPQVVLNQFNPAGQKPVMIRHAVLPLNTAHISPQNNVIHLSPQKRKHQDQQQQQHFQQQSLQQPLHQMSDKQSSSSASATVQVNQQDGRKHQQKQHFHVSQSLQQVPQVQLVPAMSDHQSMQVQRQHSPRDRVAQHQKQSHSPLMMQHKPVSPLVQKQPQSSLGQHKQPHSPSLGHQQKSRVPQAELAQRLQEKQQKLQQQQQKQQHLQQKQQKQEQQQQQQMQVQVQQQSQQSMIQVLPSQQQQQQQHQPQLLPQQQPQPQQQLQHRSSQQLQQPIQQQQHQQIQPQQQQQLQVQPQQQLQVQPQQQLQIQPQQQLQVQPQQQLQVQPQQQLQVLPQQQDNNNEQANLNSTVHNMMDNQQQQQMTSVAPRPAVGPVAAQGPAEQSQQPVQVTILANSPMGGCEQLNDAMAEGSIHTSPCPIPNDHPPSMVLSESTKHCVGDLGIIDDPMMNCDDFPSQVFGAQTSLNHLTDGESLLSGSNSVLEPCTPSQASDSVSPLEHDVVPCTPPSSISSAGELLCNGGLSANG